MEELEMMDARAEASVCPAHSERKSHHSEKVKKNLVSRLNRIEGQVRGVKGLIEKDTYCDDVITQIAAIQSALNGVSKILLEGHLKNCVLDRIQEGDLDVLDEFLVTIQKTMRK
ncbi:metal-sensitive transcriptional regulator [Heyndrickxia acidiproducens]|uniref:metal-sensitive transcriptional regulator n=1 Tax=Heyndrickxia acidiproducens TaxID=1121084 RepID=UPI00037A2D39|nr:metal-sensitive transcriptional regulator [Heyndrickxia acidiproducens]